MIEWQSDQ